MTSCFSFLDDKTPPLLVKRLLLCKQIDIMRRDAKKRMMKLFPFKIYPFISESSLFNPIALRTDCQNSIEFWLF